MFTRPNIDWILFFAIIPLLLAGLVTMNSLTGSSSLFYHQLTWIGIALVIFFVLSCVDFHFLRRTDVLMVLYVGTCVLLLFLLFFVDPTKGARSWIDLGPFNVQPSDPAKIILILLLAKYFSRRHIEIANFKHIFVSGIYAFILFALIFLEPDFGTAIVIFSIWFGMVLVSGISKKHIFLLFFIGVVAFAGAWFFLLDGYQKQRIMTFVHPMADVRGAGYNARQSAIAVGSGGLFGQGVGYGTQSRLSFLPEHQTDFIFASFAEEWGFVGVLILFLLFTIVIWRILETALRGETNFEVLYGLGVAVYLMSHFILHVGINIGLLPVTGTTIPFMSYGGTHLVTEFAALGILMGMRSYQKTARSESFEVFSEVGGGTEPYTTQSHQGFDKR